MELAVYDTYVKKIDGTSTVHFDILVPVDRYDDDEVIRFGEEYLHQKGLQTEPFDAAECRFCHIERSTPEMLEKIEQNGYYILPLDDIPHHLPPHPSRKQMIEYLRAKNESMRFLNFSDYTLEDIEQFLDRE